MSLPNILSYLRIILTITAYFLMFTSKNLFLIVLLITGLTDLLDGYFARFLKQETEWGAKLDSLADLFFYGSIFLWIVLFFKNFFMKNLLLFSVAFGFLIFLLMFHFLRHKSWGSMHLWSAKIFVASLLLFFIHGLIFGINQIFFYVLFSLCMLRCFEEFLILLKYKNPPSNVKTIYHLKKQFK